jgi:hypothetical protein
MSSAYTSAFGGVEPKYTTWKIREDGEHKQILDYIFHSKDRLQVSIFDHTERFTDLGKPNFLMVV